jgi:hypothetical protein
MVFELKRLEIRTAPKVLATSFNYYRAGKVVETLSTFFFRSSYTTHYTAVENLVEWKGRKKKEIWNNGNHSNNNNNNERACVFNQKLASFPHRARDSFSLPFVE